MADEELYIAFEVGAYMTPGEIAYIAHPNTVMPFYRGAMAGYLRLNVTDLFLPGELAVVDIPAGKQLESGMELRKATDEEIERMKNRKRKLDG